VRDHSRACIILFQLHFLYEAPNHNLLTVKETADYLPIPPPRVYYLVERGKIPPIKIGGDQAGLRQNKERRPTVLAVDDDPDVQELFRIFLKKIGFRGVVVATAKADITSLRKQKFDLMFRDLQLPEAPRDQIYESAIQIDPDLKVIVITGRLDNEVLNRILEVSAVTVLKKPLNIDQLNRTRRSLGTTCPKLQ
jgi:excisionase family DNA binding protein